jgi:2-dehydropantoate 2-reductase
MRILVVGAGALGGYYGACLARAGRDVTFLVRPGRAEQLARNGLCIVSPLGDFRVSAKTVLAADLKSSFDLIFVGTKSYSLHEAMDHFAPAVGNATVILPILNGMSHLKTLRDRFGPENVIGGTAHISGGLDPDGRVVLVAPIDKLFFGEIDGGSSDRIRELAAVLGGCGFEAIATNSIMQDMWEKWAALACAAGMGCLMRGTVGAIVAAGGTDAMLRSMDECWAVAAAAGFPPRQAVTDFCRRIYTEAGSPVQPSMMRDIERGSVTEGSHILGSFAAQARALGVPTPILDLACINVAIYEANRVT